MPGTPVLYGIQSCDRCRKALAWCASQGIPITFVDLRAKPVALEKLNEWLTKSGADRVVNQRSQTFRELSPSSRELSSGPALLKLLAMHPLLIKRPVLEYDHSLSFGFKPEHYAEIFRHPSGSD